MKTKHILQGIVVLLVTTVISIAGLTSCNYVHDHQGSFSTADSLAIAAIAQQEVAPEFTTAPQVQAYQLDVIQAEKEDSTFRALSQKQLYDISTVLLQQGKSLTVKSITEEYTKNRSVYDNLPDKPQAEEEKPQEIEESTISQDTIIDTIVDGRHVRIIKNKE